MRYIACITVIHERRRLYSCFYLLKCLQSMLKKVTGYAKNYPIFAWPPQITCRCLKVLLAAVCTFTYIQTVETHSFIHSFIFNNVFIDVFNLFTSINVHVSLLWVGCFSQVPTGSESNSVFLREKENCITEYTVPS